MSRFIKYISLLGLVLGLFSCAKKLTEMDQVKLDRKKTSDLIAVMDIISHKKPNFFYTKIATSFSDTNRNISFKTSIRMVKDSAINTLITYASFPVINSIITKDTVKIVNKKDKCFSIQSLGYIKQNFGIDFSYTNLEELILGMPLDYDITQKYFQIHDPYNYTLSSHKKREIKRLDRNEKLQEKEDIIVKYLLSDNLTSMKGMFIESPSDSTSIQVDYTAREIVDGFSIPRNVLMRIKSPRNLMVLELRYDKIEINQPQPLFLVIPEGYEECK
jgi:hypothetical protein